MKHASIGSSLVLSCLGLEVLCEEFFAVEEGWVSDEHFSDINSLNTVGNFLSQSNVFRAVLREL